MVKGNYLQVELLQLVKNMNLFLGIHLIPIGIVADVSNREDVFGYIKFPSEDPTDFKRRGLLRH